MDIDSYQKKAHTFREDDLTIVSSPLLYPVLGLTEEVGEVAGKFAKAVREEGGVITPERFQAVCCELGDVVWFVAEICTCLGVSFSSILEANLEKLDGRKTRGVINGNGDLR